MGPTFSGDQVWKTYANLLSGKALLRRESQQINKLGVEMAMSRVSVRQARSALRDAAHRFR